VLQLGNWVARGESVPVPVSLQIRQCLLYPKQLWTESVGRERGCLECKGAGASRGVRPVTGIRSYGPRCLLVSGQFASRKTQFLTWPRVVDSADDVGKA